MLLLPTLLLALPSAPQSTVDPCEVRPIRALSPTEDSRFGEVLAWNGTHLAVSAPGHPRGDSVGRVEVYERDGDNWFTSATLDPDPLTHPDSIPIFGLGLTWYGDELLVGAPDINSIPTDDGRVYRFQDDGAGNWVQIGQLLAPDANGIGGFGGSLFVHDDQLFVIDRVHSQVNAFEGAVYVFDRAGDDWSFLQKLRPSDGVGFELFGSGLAAEGDRLVVGAILAEQAYAFDQQSDGTWTEAQILTGPTATLQSFFGASAVIGDGTLFVGAYRTSLTNTWEGVVEVFEHDGTQWQATQTLIDSDPVDRGSLGFHVSYDEGRLVAGTTSGPSDLDLGQVLIFEDVAGSWAETARLSRTITNRMDRFGYHSVIDGDLLLVGAPGYAPFTDSPGFVQSYSLSGLACADLVPDTEVLPASTGGVQTLTLDAGPENAGDLFVLVGSLSGVYRGARVGSLRVPLDVDGYTLAILRGAEVPLSTVMGVLDAQGQATVTVTVGPNDAELGPLVVRHAYLRIDQGTGAFEHASVPSLLLFDNSQ